MNGGDQFLDGIGETALVARYRLGTDAADSSRNGYHATLQGTGGRYIHDPKFGRVLSLAETGESFLSIPPESLAGVETLTVSAWVFLRSARPSQPLFEFGSGTTSDFFCTPIGESPDRGYRASLTTNGQPGEQGATAPNVPTNRWVHLAVALDASRHELSLYQDGIKVGHSPNLTRHLEHVLEQEEVRHNHLYFGQAHSGDHPYLDAKLHDLRLYSVALTDLQVATIWKNGSVKGNLGQAAESAPASTGPEITAELSPAGLDLAEVAEITVETTVGSLPRLPRSLPGLDASGRTGPPVRIIWPAPTNNESVLQPGTFTITGRVVGSKVQPKATVSVKAAPPSAPAVHRHVEAFPLGRVTLNLDAQQRSTAFMKHRDKFMRGLAKSDPDRFLYMFRDAFGQKQPDRAQPLGGWDSQTTRLRGHASGHYLTAIAQAYASTAYDPALHNDFQAKMNYLIDTLDDLSQKSGKPAQANGPSNADAASVPPGPGRTNYDSNLSKEGIRTDYWNWGLGFISAYPPDQFIMLENGATYGTSNTQIWAPYYTLHKVLAGLLDSYEIGGNRKALAIAEGMGRWVYQRLKTVPPATRVDMWNRYIAGEYGGMNEVLARLSRLTGDERFREGARLFDNVTLFYGDASRSHGLACNVDTLRGKHANQHIPQVTGALELYRVTKEHPYYAIADNFWHLCTEGYLYSIGGVAGARNPNNAECFTVEPDSLFANGFARGGQNETCATYNLLKLTRQLFMFDPRAEYMDYYEQALYNDILASVAADNPGNTYHISLNPSSRKQFGNASMDGFSCCNGTALESATKLQDSIYFHDADQPAVYINLFVPSTLAWLEQNVTLTQRTSFPYEDRTQVVIGGTGAFDLNIRVPRWASSGFQVKINGQATSVQATPGTYAKLHRDWKDQDTIEIRMPFTFRLDRVMDQPNIASLFYGPILLAADEPEARSDWRPVVLNVANIGKSMKGDPATLVFTVGDATFRPFYETFGRYSVYFDARPAR